MARASCANRSLNLAAEILMATMRSSRVSLAFHTCPMPPAPMRERISYGPSFAPGFSSIGPWVIDSLYYTEATSGGFTRRENGPDEADLSGLVGLCLDHGLTGKCRGAVPKSLWEADD